MASNDMQVVPLKVSNLAVEVATESGWTTIVDDVSFSVARGETLGIVGESGSGKTVTALSIMGLMPREGTRVAGGSIELEGNELVGASEQALEQVRGRDIGMVFQEPMTSLNPAIRIGEQICESIRRHLGFSRRAARQRAIDLLGRVGIPNPQRRVDDYPHEFSGGMRQRVMIALALACEPRVLIADEPTTALDVTIQAQILQLLKDMQDELGIAMLFITHNMGVVAQVCDSVAVMYAGQVVDRAPTVEMFHTPAHPYTEGLLRSLPSIGNRPRRLPLIPGRPPEPWAMPSGCRFHPRCPFATQECETGPIPVVASGGSEARCLYPNTFPLEVSAP